jgi:hypothetical protein
MFRLILESWSLRSDAQRSVRFLISFLLLCIRRIQIRTSIRCPKLSAVDFHVFINVVTNGRAAFLITTCVFDRAMDLFGTCFLQRFLLQFTVAPSSTDTIRVCVALLLLHTVYSLPVVHYARTKSSRSDVPPTVLGYRLPTADVSFPWFPNSPRRTARATLHSRRCH